MPERHRSRFSPVALSVLAVSIGGTLYGLWDNWWVNWDGGAYLGLAKSLNESRGLAFPDGSQATFRGPGYPGLFAVGWTFLEASARSAIWISRAVLLAGGGIVAWIVGRMSGALPAVPAGLLAVTPALILESGAWYFVPDGMAIVLVLLSVVVSVAKSGSPSVTTGVIAGVLMAAAVLTKETAILYSPIVPIVMWSQVDRRGAEEVRAAGSYLLSLAAIVAVWVGWASTAAQSPMPLPGSSMAAILVLVALAGLGLLLRPAVVYHPPGSKTALWVAIVGFPAGLLVTFTGLVLIGDPLIMSAIVGLEALGDALARFLGWAWVPALVLLIVGAVQGHKVPSIAAPTWLAGILLMGVGLGQMWYAAAAGLSLRNGVGAVIGFSLVVGTTFWVSRGVSLRVLTALSLGAFLLLAALTTARIDSTRSAEAESWDNGAVHELGSWLSGSSFDSITITPTYATYLYFLQPSLPEPELLSWHFDSSAPESRDEQSFCRRLWWASDIPDCPNRARTRVVQGNQRVVGALFADRDQAGPLVVTGTTGSSSAFNGNGLLYSIEKFDLGEPLFATSQAHLPHWAVVYEFDWDRWSSDSIPAVVQPDVAGVEDLVGDSIPFDRDEFMDLLTDLLPP